jgi:hypothetical protein
VSTVDAPKIETMNNPSLDSPELGKPRAPASVHGGQGGWALVAATAGGAGEAAIRANGTGGWR